LVKREERGWVVEQLDRGEKGAKGAVSWDINSRQIMVVMLSG
jgi:hypothetical protein